MNQQTKSSLIVASWILLGFVAVAGILWFLAPTAPDAAVTSQLLTVASDDHVKGPQNAPVTLVEYLDFECPACAAYFPVIQQLQQEFPNDLKVVTRHFPLTGHRNGLASALAVEAAGQQGKFYEMQEALFTDQKAWGAKQAADPTIFEGYAQRLGLDLEKFKADVASAVVGNRVQRDMDSGRELGISGTPSFFLNGTKLDNPANYEAFKTVIQKAITDAGGASVAPVVSPAATSTATSTR